MRASMLKFTLLIPFFLIVACGGGSGSNHSPGPVPVDPVPEDPAPAPEYAMPPLVDVLPPEEDFTLACADGLPEVADVIPPAGEDAGGDTGYLVDAAVTGLAYETPTHRGVTGADGSFHYEQGETVRFTLGDLLLGEVEGKTQVTPFDLAGTEAPVGMTAIAAALEDDGHPFHRAINTALLLQSVDRDGNPGNGIEITPEMDALFRGVKLELDQPWREFSGQFWLNHAIAQANGRGFFSEAHGVVKPARALTRLYGTLGIDAMTMGVSLEEEDWDGDGAPNQTRRREYDPDGYLATIEQFNDEGMLEAVESWNRDANGNRTVYEQEDFGERSSERWQYDTQGRLMRLETDENGDGAPDGTVDFEYETDGRPLRVAFSGISGDRLVSLVDQLELPTIQFLGYAKIYTITYQYDAAGNTTGDVLEGFHPDLGRDTLTRTYDAHGNAIHVERRFETPPGSVELYTYENRYEYDSDGNVTLEAIDRTGDGAAERTTRFEYDAGGRLIRKETVERFPYEGGILYDTETISYQYDGNGSVTREAVDRGGDGSVDYIITYEYDGHGKLVRSDRRDADGTLDEIVSGPFEYEYDAGGKLISRVVRGDYDLPEEIVTYSYHADGTLAREDHQFSRDALHNITTWYYNAIGQPVREEWDGGANGVTDRVTSSTYGACGNLRDRSVSRVGEDSDSAEHWRYDIDAHLRRYEWTNKGYIDGLPDDLPQPFQSTGFESWQYDADGWPTRYQGECEGGGCSFDYYQFVNQIVNYEYDDAGNLTRELVDRDGDGNPDRVTANEYDSLGNLLRNLLDEDGDGSADHVVSYEYDAAGNVTREMRDENGDGRFRVISYSYDADNRLTRRENIGADGKLNSIETLEYDDRGNLLRQASEAGDDGHEYGISVHTYDAMGNRTRTEEDGDGDGVVDTIRIWEYDADGNLVREGETIINEEGEHVEFSHSYQYDAEGNLIRESEGFDPDGDGIPDEVEIRHYVPTGWGHLFASPAGY